MKLRCRRSKRTRTAPAKSRYLTGPERTPPRAKSQPTTHHDPFETEPVPCLRCGSCVGRIRLCRELHGPSWRGIRIKRALAPLNVIVLLLLVEPNTPFLVSMKWQVVRDLFSTKIQNRWSDSRCGFVGYDSCYYLFFCFLDFIFYWKCIWWTPSRYLRNGYACFVILFIVFDVPLYKVCISDNVLWNFVEEYPRAFETILSAS